MLIVVYLLHQELQEGFLRFRFGRGEGSRVITNSSEKQNPNSLWVTCYPLYSLMVATDLTTVDFLSLDIESMELKVLETIPWDDVDIKAILVEFQFIPEGKTFLKQFLEHKNYKLVKELAKNYFFVKQN
ncbi:Protein Star [Armadillidium vulgare]|nr:Protein Star [Armadillidium vulgare]